MFGNIKRRPADTKYSAYLRSKITACEKCGNKNTLQVSHFYGRRHESTRFEIDNCDVICFSCHRKFHEDPNDYREWKLKKLGPKRFKSLDIQAHAYQKKDDSRILLWLKNL